MGKMFEDSKIGVDLCHDSGTANLQDDRRATAKRGPMYLRDRGGGVGLGIKIGIGPPLNSI